MQSTTILLIPIALAIFGQLGFENNGNIAPLSDADTLEIVQAQREAKAISELERKQRILGVEADKEVVEDKGGHKMILRRVGWKHRSR